MEKLNKPESEWRKQLTDEQYRVCRQKGTEYAFSGDLYNVKDPGEYLCVACGQPLFDSAAKYDSGSGWPSFYSPRKMTAVEEHRDLSHGMMRTEVVCARCDSHLGHVFPDGPEPTGLRYCINSVSLRFKPRPEGGSAE